MIHIVLKVILKPPFKKSFNTLLDFCNIWSSSIIHGGTKNIEAQISVPEHKFEKLFKERPKVSEFKIPKGAEFFMQKVEVINIIVSQDKINKKKEK